MLNHQRVSHTSRFRPQKLTDLLHLPQKIDAGPATLDPIFQPALNNTFFGEQTGCECTKNQLPNKDMAIKPNCRTFLEATITRLPDYHISHLLQLQACLPSQIPNVDAGGQRKPPGLAANWHPTGAWFGKGSRNIQAPSIRLKLCGLPSPW